MAFLNTFLLIKLANFDLNILLKFTHTGLVYKMPSLIQVKAWHQKTMIFTQNEDDPVQ